MPLFQGSLEPNQANLVTFVLLDDNGDEYTGLMGNFTLQLSKAGGAFAASTGTKAEIGLGFYSYEFTAAECDTIGPISVVVTDAAIQQQNLEYVVGARNAGCSPHTHTVINSSTMLPEAGADVWFTTDEDGDNVVWEGVSDANGIANDINGNLPCLDPGDYYVWEQIAGFIDDDTPALITVT